MDYSERAQKAKAGQLDYSRYGVFELKKLIKTVDPKIKKINVNKKVDLIRILNKLTNQDIKPSESKKQRIKKQAEIRYQDLAKKAINKQINPSRYSTMELKKLINTIDPTTPLYNDTKKGLIEILNKVIDSNIRNQVINFMTSNARTITFENLDEQRYKSIIDTIIQNYPSDRRFTISDKDGRRFMTLTMSNLIKLKNMPYMITKEEAKDSSQYTISEVHLNDTIRIDKWFPEEEAEKKKKRKQDRLSKADFFPFLNKTIVDLTRYQIYDHINKNNYKNNCFIFALIQSKLFTDVEINNVKTYVHDRSVPLNKLETIAQLLKTKITVRKDSEQSSRVFGADFEKHLKLGILNEHYFIIEKTKYNNYAILHYNELKDKKTWWKIKDINQKREDRGLDSYSLIKLMLQLNMFEKITLDTKNIMDIQYYDHVDDQITNLAYTENETKEIKITPDVENKYTNIYFADFETTTDGDSHEAYLCCIIDDQGNEAIFKGPNCGVLLLEHIKNNSTVYFHNLGYDASFFIKYLYANKIIKTGSRIKTLSGTYKGKSIKFNDSLALIDKPLKDFPEIFKLTVKKEVMPYTLYDKTNIKLNQIEISEALKHLKEEDHSEFIELIQPYKTSDTHFAHLAYAEFYCLQDCRVLKQGLMTFRNWINEVYDLDVYNFISLPGLMYKYLLKKECLKGVYALSGIPRLFIQKCVKGGRVMTRSNRKWLIDVKTEPQDACSLYPSAMAIMDGFLLGKPKVLQQDQLNLDFLNTTSGYFIEITNVKTNIDLAFPLQAEQDEQGILVYTNHFTKNLFIDKIALEDFIKFQGATFDIVRGYYFDQGHNNTINTVIKDCYKDRLKYKKDKNPIETAIKLMLNSAYGKLLQKPIKSDLKIKNTEEQHKKFLNYQYDFIKDCSKICPGKYIYKLQKPIQQHFNVVHCGVEILSHSKRIMNKVMCLAEDKGIKIYYQDTDSMHIESDKVEYLNECYKQLYKQDLLGDELGQFKNDLKGNKRALKSYYLGKKCYINQVSDGQLKICLKGVGDSVVMSEEKTPMKIFEQLASGRPYTFDLAKNRPTFKRNNNFSYKTLTKFERKIKFPGNLHIA